MKPIVVLGQPRGGTSLVAGILHLLGVDMGINGFNNENDEFIGVSPGRYEELIEEYKHYKIWGFKNPTLIDDIELYLPKLRGSKFVVVFRDVWSIASSEKVRMGFNIYHALNTALERSERLVKFVSENDCHAVSYEHLIRHPKREVDELAMYLGLVPKQMAYEYVRNNYTCVLCFKQKDECECRN